jgi:hypothetical protein
MGKNQCDDNFCGLPLKNLLCVTSCPGAFVAILEMLLPQLFFDYRLHRLFIFSGIRVVIPVLPARQALIAVV